MSHCYFHIDWLHESEPSDQNSKLVRVAKNDRHLNMSSLVSSTFVTLTSHPNTLTPIKKHWLATLLKEG